MTIHLVPALLPGSSDLPGNSGGQPSNASLFGLAPGGVYLAPTVTGRTGELLPHPFTLTRHSVSSPYTPKSSLEDMAKRPQSPYDLSEETECLAVSFLWHLPSRRRDWALPSTLSCGARTFLPLAGTAKQRSSVLLRHTQLFGIVQNILHFKVA